MPTEIMAAMVAVVPTLTGVWASILSNRSNKHLVKIEKDIAVCKEASFYALQAHVENGVNGDVKKAHQRLRENVFKGERA